MYKILLRLTSSRIGIALPLVPILFFYANFFKGIYNPRLNQLDWYIFNTEVEVYRSSLSNFSLPGALKYEISNATALANIGSYYPAFPYGIRTPDVFLLPFVSNLSFIFIHVTWVTALGLYGLYKISKEISISYSAYVILSITWFLSGPLVARMGIGHTPLFGYFLIPLFFYLLLRLNSSKIHWVSASNMGIFLFLIGLLGSAIVLFQMCLIIIINIFINLKQFKNYLLSICIGLMLSSYTIVPAFFQSPYINASNRTVFEGYGWNFSNDLILKDTILNFTFTLESILNVLKVIFLHFANIVKHILSALWSPTAVLKDGGWEWTLYSGVMYIPILLIIIVLVRQTRFTLFNNKRDNYSILITCIILAVISVSLVYRYIFKLLNLVIDFPAIDRMPYRMMIYVLFVSYLYLLKNFELILQRYISYKSTFILKVFILLSQYISMFSNGNYWSLSNINETFQTFDENVGSNDNIFSQVSSTPRATADFYIGYGISFFSIIVLINMYRTHWLSKKSTISNPNAD